jgi:ABC transporter substrate binding protein
MRKVQVQTVGVLQGTDSYCRRYLREFSTNRWLISTIQNYSLSSMVGRVRLLFHSLYASFAPASSGRDALMVSGDPFLDTQRDLIVALAARYSLPTIYHWRDFVAGGGLMSYGASINDAYRQSGVYVGRILKGENPADLPVMLPTKFELVINLRTARSLALAVPATLLATADEVIE